MKEVVNEGNTHKANLLVVRFVFVIVHITFVSMEYLLLHTALVLPLFQLQIRLHVHQHIHVVINFGKSVLFICSMSLMSSRLLLQKNPL